MAAFLSLLILDARLRKWRYGLALALYAAILVLGSVRGARVEIGHYATGLVLHSVAYGGITFLLFTGSPGTPARRALQAVLTVVVMGALDETLQSFLSYRKGTTGDWMVDCIAAIVTAGLLWAFLPAPAVSTSPPSAPLSSE